MAALGLGLKFGLILEPLLTVGYILAVGALITSIGLALATWSPRQGRAVGLSVAAFAFLAIGWPLIVSSLGLGRFGEHSDADGLMLGAPWSGSHRLLDPYVTLVRPYSYGYDRADADGESPLLRWAALWVVLDLAIAAGLIAATLRTFNRCLGRVDEVFEYAGPVRVVLESGPHLDADRRAESP